MSSSKNRGAILLALLAFVLTTAIYLVWMPNSYSGDDLQQSIAIQQQVSGQLFYHPAGGLLYEPGLTTALSDEARRIQVNPRYLLESPTSVAVASIWKALGWQGNVITPIVTFRAVVGGLGVLLIFLALYELRGNAIIAFIASMGTGLSLSYWTYSTHVDQSINMVTLICLAFYVLVRCAKTGMNWRGKALLAIILVFASFYNFTAVLSTLAFGLAVMFVRPGETWVDRFKNLIAFYTIYGLLVTVGIVLAVAILASPSSITNADFWRGILFAGKPEYGIQLVNDTFRAVLGFAKSQVVYPGVPGSLQEYWDIANSSARALLLAYYSIILVLLLIPVSVLALRRRYLPVDEQWLWILLPAWFGFHAVFNWFWDPGFIKYWLIPLMCLWIVVALFLDHLYQTAPSWSHPALVVAVLFIVFTFTLNFTTSFLHQSREEDNEWLMVAEALSESQPNALFISSAHTLDFYIAYFSHRNIISTSLINYDTGNNGEILRTILNEQIARHRADGGDIYLFAANPDDLELLGRTIELEDRRQLESAWEFPNLTIYKVVFEPSS